MCERIPILTAAAPTSCQASLRMGLEPSCRAAVSRRRLPYLLGFLEHAQLRTPATRSSQSLSSLTRLYNPPGPPAAWREFTSHGAALPLPRSAAFVPVQVGAASHLVSRMVPFIAG